MRWFAHSVGGVGSLWAIAPAIASSGGGPTESGTAGLMLCLAVLGALFPDLDAAHSKLKSLEVLGLKPFVLPSAIFHHWLGHRGFLHSLLGLGLFATIVGVPLGLNLGWQVGLASVLGYGSHLLLDSATVMGIPLWYPHRARVHLLPRRLRIVTGSVAEDILTGLLVVLCAGLVPLLFVGLMPF